MSNSVAALFWASIAIVYHHAIYPILLHQLAKRRQLQAGSVCAPKASLDDFPSLTMLVPVHNEEKVIAAKIVNMAALIYPQEKLTFVIAFDGCSDRTKAIAEATISRIENGHLFRLIEYGKNVGKVAVLNDQISAATSELVALTDASAELGEEALIKAATHFSNACVGVVSGTYSVADAGTEGERSYWRYQTQIKRDEAALAAPMGAHGAFYMFRRALWQPLPEDTINDDFVLPMAIALRGFRVLYDSSIPVRELERTGVRQEFRRRVRIGAGNLQQTIRLAGLGNPRRGWLAFLFWSGKGLRSLLPFVLIVAFSTSAMLAAMGQFIYQVITAVALALATVTALFTISGKIGDSLPRPVQSLCYLVQGHAASAAGAILLITGKKAQAWRVSKASKKKLQ
jgi:cellulose synthase/poly-beta-1,6-N-acetylglucosamine synthase-like glycosyltransferase